MVINHFLKQVKMQDKQIEQVLYVVVYDVYEHLLDLNKLLVEVVDDEDVLNHLLLVEDLENLNIDIIINKINILFQHTRTCCNIRSIRICLLLLLLLLRSISSSIWC